MIHDLLPDGDALLALEPEERAGLVLQYLSAIDPSSASELNRYNFSQANTVREYPVHQQEAITLALVEAWVWLEREGLLAPQPGDISGNWVFVTRRGRKVATPEKLQAYRRANLHPRQLLHPSVAQSEPLNRCRDVPKHLFSYRFNNLAPETCLSVFPRK